MMQRGELGQDSLYQMNDELLTKEVDSDYLKWLEEQMPDDFEALNEMLRGVHVFSEDDHIEIVMVVLREKGLLTWDNENIQVRIWW